VALVIAFAVPATAAAADPAEIGVAPLDNLLSGADPNGFLEAGGSYRAAFGVEGSVISADLTFELPPATTDAEPGPIVVFWQFALVATDDQFADVHTQMIDQPQIAIISPECGSSGTCHLAVRVSGSTHPALEAADLEWVLSMWVQLLVTVVRTYDHGAFVQLSAPDYADETGGTLANPMSVEGSLLSTAVIDPDTSNAVDMPGRTQFFYGGPPYDWASALEGALGHAAPSASFTPAPTHSPTISTRADGESPGIVALIAMAAVIAAATGLAAISRRRR
jgi:hypothetical protein